MWTSGLAYIIIKKAFWKMSVWNIFFCLYILLYWTPLSKCWQSSHFCVNCRSVLQILRSWDCFVYKYKNAFSTSLFVSNCLLWLIKLQSPGTPPIRHGHIFDRPYTSWKSVNSGEINQDSEYIWNINYMMLQSHHRRLSPGELCRSVWMKFPKRTMSIHHPCHLCRR